MICVNDGFLSPNISFGLSLLNFSSRASLPVPGATPGLATQRWAMPLNERPDLFNNFIELCSSAKGENVSPSLRIGGDYFVDTLKGRADAKIIDPGHVRFRIGDIGENKTASMGIELRRDTRSESLLAVLTYRSKEPQFSVQQSTYLPVNMRGDAPPSNSAREGVGTTIITSGSAFLNGAVRYSKTMGRPLLPGWLETPENFSGDKISPSIIFKLASLFGESDFYFSRSTEDGTVGLRRDDDGLIVSPEKFEEDRLRNEEIYVASLGAGLAAYNAPDSMGEVKTTEDMPRIMVYYSPREKAPYFKPGEKFEGGDKPTIQIIQNARVFWWGAEPFANVINGMLGSAASLYGLPYHEDEGRGV